MVNKVFNCFFFIYESICICFLWNVRCYEFNGWVVVSKLYNGFFFVNCFVKLDYEYKFRLYWKIVLFDLFVYLLMFVLEDINIE